MTKSFELRQQHIRGIRSIWRLLLRKKVNESSDISDDENKKQDLEITLHTIHGDYNITEDDSLCSDSIWEPGLTETLYISVKNNSSQDFNYSISLEATDIVKNLNEVISYIITSDATINAPVSDTSLDWSTGKHLSSGSNIVTQEFTLMPSEEYFFAISLHMDENSSNKYQDGNITFNIKVIEINPS